MSKDSITYGAGEPGGGTSPFITTVPPEAVGLEASFSPFLQFNTGQRTTMFSSNIWQAVVLHGAEYPQFSTGIENQAMLYSFNSSKREQDGTVFESIPKFISGIYGVKRNPKTYIFIISRGVADYVEVSDFTKLYNGFGYMNDLTTAAMFANQGRGTPLDKDVALMRPPNHKDANLSADGDQGELYCQGLNANILFTPMPHVAEDSIVIRKGWAEKCSHHAIHTVKITLKQDEVPLNLYGTPDEPKVFPDIGELVNQENILMAIRKKSPERFAALTASSLQSVLYGDDRIIYAPAGAKLLDVQVYCDARSHRDNERDPGIMGQIYGYQGLHHRFYEKVCKLYQEMVAEGYSIAPKLNDLVTTCMTLRKQKATVPLVDGRDIVKNCVIELTYSYVRKVGPGFKFSGRSGDKGVDSCIWDDEDMPVDEQGIRADIIASADTVSNRINDGQLYEQFFNRLSVLMQQRLIRGELGSGVKAYKAIMEYIMDVHRAYGELLGKQLPTKENKLDFVDEVKCHGIFFVVPAFLEEITMDKIMFLRKKYNYVRSPVTFSYMVDGVKKTFTTKDPMDIGSKYVYLLGKIPKMQMAAHEMTHINQFGMPVKSESKELKQQYATAPTPIRWGEDEVGLLSMLPSPDETARFLMMRAGCKAATDLIAETLLTTPNPSAVGKFPMKTKEMLKRSETIKLMNHTMGIVGVDMGEDSIGRK